MKRSQKFLTFTGLLLYLAILGIGTWRHVLWRDEAGVWLIGRFASWHAFFRTVHYEGHPPLWFFVVRPFARIFANPGWIKLPNLLATLASAGLILSFRKRPLPVRIGFLFSYFLLFEYGLIARNYMLGVACLLAAVAWRERGRSLTGSAAFLAAAVLSSEPALVLACCLFGYWMLGYWKVDGRIFERRERRGHDIWSALAVMLVAVTGAMITIYPPADSALWILREHGSVRLRISQGLLSLSDAYLPIPGHWIHFWNVTLVDRGPVWLGMTLGVVLLLILGIYFRRRPENIFFLAATLSLIALDAVTGRLMLRHVGWLFVAFVLSILLGRSQPNTHRMGWRAWFLGAVLTVQALSGAYATAVSVYCPFSSSLAVVQFLRTRHLDRDPLTFSPAVIGLSVLAYMERSSAFYPEYDGQASYVTWTRSLLLGQHLITPQRMQMLGEGGQPVVLISETPLSAGDLKALDLVEIGEFSNEIATAYPYRVYLRPGSAAR